MISMTQRHPSSLRHLLRLQLHLLNAYLLLSQRLLLLCKLGIVDHCVDIVSHIILAQSKLWQRRNGEKDNHLEVGNKVANSALQI